MKKVLLTTLIISTIAQADTFYFSNMPDKIVNLSTTEFQAPPPFMMSSVPDESVKIQNNRELYMMTEMLYFEARDQNRKGQIAVGFATMNRVRSGKFPNSIEEVVHFKRKNKYGNFTCAYSYYCDGKSDRMENTNAKLDVTISASAVLGGMEDFTGGSTLYFNYDVYKQVPHWAMSVCTVYLGKWGDHEFYDQDIWKDCEKQKPNRFSRKR